MKLYDRENPKSDLLKIESKERFKNTDTSSGKKTTKPITRGITKTEWLEMSKEDQDKWYMFEM